MNRSRRLSLKSEALTALTPADLEQVAGAQAALSDKYGHCTLDESYRVCSLFCQTTYNTCAC